MLPVLLALSALAAPPASAGSPEGPRVEVLAGRALLAQEGGVRRLIPELGSLPVRGPAYVETGPGSRIVVRWRGAATLHMSGEGAVEWEGSTGALAWTLAGVESAHVEVRRGPLAMALPGGWEVELPRGACFLASRPDGSLELRHDAGLPLRLVPPRDAGFAAPPYTVLAGARLALAAGARTPESLAGRRPRVLAPYGLSQEPRGGPGRPAWSGFAWPWNPALEPTEEPREVGWRVELGSRLSGNRVFLLDPPASPMARRAAALADRPWIGFVWPWARAEAQPGQELPAGSGRRRG